METWRYELTGQAERDLRQLDRAVRQRILRALDRFVAKPGPVPFTTRSAATCGACGRPRGVSAASRRLARAVHGARGGGASAAARFR